MLDNNLKNVILNLYEQFSSDNINILSKNDFYKCLRKFLKINESVLNIGRVEFVLKLPKNLFSKQSINEKIVIFDDSCSDAESFTYETNLISEFDSISFINYPLFGEFDENQKNTLKFIEGIFSTHFKKFLYIDYIHESKYLDSMTSAPNFIGILEKSNILKHKFGSLKDYYCLFLNIRDFKNINASIGPIAGNELLTNYFLRAEELLFEDEVFGRVGGDNFVALIENEHLDEFLDELNHSYLDVYKNNKKNTFRMKSRVGIYKIKENDDFSDVIQRASIANSICKLLKESDRFYYSDDMTGQFNIEQQIVMNFTQALKNKEFEIFYQPKISAITKKVVGAEALVRWNKDGSFISPSDFISVLEKKGLIHKLDMYIFDRVCSDIRNMLNEGIDVVRISVNLSRNDLQDDNLFDILQSIMKKYDIDKKYIEFEITESSVYDNPSSFTNFISKLNDNDISVAVDDFGTGYSSLLLIKDYSFDTVKIDKSFVDSIVSKDEKNLLFLKNIVKLLKDLDKDIVVEGVESREQLEYLVSIGCETIQGYVYEKVLPFEKFKSLLISDKKYF